METKPGCLKAETNIVCNEDLAIQYRALGRQKTLEKNFCLTMINVA